MPKYDFNKVAKQLYWNHTSAWVFSGKFVLVFRMPFYKNASGGLLLTEILLAKLNGDNLIPINSSRFFHYPDSSSPI